MLKYCKLNDITGYPATITTYRQLIVTLLKHIKGLFC
jgi:hypothetical protein